MLADWFLKMRHLTAGSATQPKVHEPELFALTTHCPSPSLHVSDSARPLFGIRTAVLL